MKKNILFILPTLHAGGAENYALRFMKYFLTDFNFHVLSVSLDQGDLYDEFYDLGLPIYFQSIGYFNLKKAFQFYRFLKSKQFDVVCGFNGNFDGMPLMIARFAGVKNRISFYRRSTNAFKKNALKSIYNTFVNYLVRKNATFILSNSLFAFENLHGRNYKKDLRYKLIPNGIDSSLYDIEITKAEARGKLNLPVEAFIVGHIGRFDPAKNHTTIFKVAKELTQLYVNVVFVFCGKNTDGENFRNELEKHEILHNTITLGLQKELPLVYKAMDVFYFPSITEGQPNALIEAMFSDLPIIASNIPPIMEATPTNFHTKLIDPNNVGDQFFILEKFVRNSIDIEEYKLRTFALENFNLNERLYQFKEILNHGNIRKKTER